MRAYGKSVTGLKRKNNEDAIYIATEESSLKNLYIVADGMGGHNAGEVASNGTIEAFQEYAQSHIDSMQNENEILDILVEAVQYCNSVIYHKSIESEKLSEMGTTLIIAVILNNKLYVTHVGDSRLYLYRQGEIRQLTNDHSYVMELVRLGKITREEAAVHPNRNVITRAVGTHQTIEIDTIIEPLLEGDKILICSDGLSTMVDDWEIEEVLKKELTGEEKVQALIDKANANGGLDNISLIIIE